MNREKPKTPRQILFKALLKLGIVFFASYVFVFLIKELFLFSYIVPDSKMEPTISKGKKVFIKKMVSEKNLFLNDVILIKNESGKVFLSRIIARSGDKVLIQAKKVFRNGNEVSSKEIKFTDKRPSIPERISYRDFYPEINIKEKHYFLLSDNRDEGIDSRELGQIPLDKVVGKVWF